MRRLMMAAVAAATLAGAGTLASSAQAFPAASGLSRADVGQVENVALICPRPVWNGWRWVQPACYRTRPAIIAPYAYVAPPPVVVVRPWRRRLYY